jgi:hypothetical protein
MTAWLEHHKKLQRHTAYIQLQEGLKQTPEHIEKPIGPPLPHTYLIKMAQHPSAKWVGYNDLADKYRATYFQDALEDFIAAHKSGAASTIQAWGAKTLFTGPSGGAFQLSPPDGKAKATCNW